MARHNLTARSLLTLSAFGLLLCVPAMRTTAQAQRLGCPGAERREALSAIQAHILRMAPDRIDSVETAMRPGGALAGWRLSHGYVVLQGVGAIVVQNPDRKFPEPQALFYAPAPDSKPSDWLDFGGPDEPYRLAGWAYLSPWRDGSKPPLLVPCVTGAEWVVHEAGWHLRDGGMRLTPGFEEEPPRPSGGAGVDFWHPRHWDLRFWRGADGAPLVSFHNPDARPGGLHLPRGSFFYMIDGRPWPDPGQRAAIPVRWAE